MKKENSLFKPKENEIASPSQEAVTLSSNSIRILLNLKKSLERLYEVIQLSITPNSGTNISPSSKKKKKTDLETKLLNYEKKLLLTILGAFQENDLDLSQINDIVSQQQFSHLVNQLASENTLPAHLYSVMLEKAAFFLTNLNQQTQNQNDFYNTLKKHIDKVFTLKPKDMYPQFGIQYNKDFQGTFSELGLKAASGNFLNTSLDGSLKAIDSFLALRDTIPQALLVSTLGDAWLTLGKSTYINGKQVGPFFNLKHAEKIAKDPKLFESVFNYIDSAKNQDKETDAAINNILNVLGLSSNALQNLYKAALGNNNAQLSKLIKETSLIPNNNNQAPHSSDYETILVEALKDPASPLPPYFDDARIEQYFLDQIAEFEKSGKLGGADAMRAILKNAALPLRYKLNMLAAIGKGKSNNTFLSLSRMGRRKEVREFYKNLQVFAKLDSSDKISEIFEKFLRNSKKTNSKIKNIEHHIQRYTLLRLGLKDLQPTPRNPEYFSKGLGCYCATSLSTQPLKVLNEIKLTQHFLTLAKPDIQEATASSTNPGNYAQQFSQWIQFAIATQTPPQVEDLLLIGAQLTPQALLTCYELVDKNSKKLGDSASLFIHALAKSALSTKNETQIKLVRALAEKANTPGVQDVFNEIFYQAALNKNEKNLIKLAKEISNFQPPKQEETFLSNVENHQHNLDATPFNQELSLQQPTSRFDLKATREYLFNQALCRLPCTNQYFSYISLPQDENSASDKEEIIQTILQSKLLLSQKSQILANINQALAEKAAHPYMPHSGSCSLSSADISKTNFCFVFTYLLAHREKHQNALTYQDIVFGFKAFWQNLLTTNSSDQVATFERFLDLIVENAKTDIMLLATIVQESIKIFTRLNKSKNARALNYEKANNIKSLLNKCIVKILSEQDLDLTQVIKIINASRELFKQPKSFQTNALTTKINTEPKDPSIASSIQNEINTENTSKSDAEKKKSVRFKQTYSMATYSLKNKNTENIFKVSEKNFSMQQAQKKTYNGYSIQQYLFSRFNSLNIANTNIKNVFDSSLPLFSKFLFSKIIAQKICQNSEFQLYSEEVKNFYSALAEFENAISIKEVYPAFTVFLKSQQVIPKNLSNINTYLSRYKLIQQSLSLILPETFEDESLQNEFKKWMDDNVFEDPSTIFDEIKGFQQFLDNNKTAIDSAIANNTHSEKFQEFFMSWVNFFFTTRGDLSFEDLNYIGASPTKEDFIICTKLILARNDTELRIKDIFPKLINPYFKQLLSKEKNFYDQLKFLLEFCLETKQPIDLTLMTTHPNERMPQSDKPQIIIPYMQNILINSNISEVFEKLSEETQKALITSLGKYLMPYDQNRQPELNIIEKNWKDITQVEKNKSGSENLNTIFEILHKITYRSYTFFSQHPKGIQKILAVRHSSNAPSDIAKLTQIKQIIEDRKNRSDFYRSNITKAICEAFDTFFSSTDINLISSSNANSLSQLVSDLRKISSSAAAQNHLATQLIPF